jgi:hypothetical protein
MTKDGVFWAAAGFVALSFGYEVIRHWVGEYLDDRRERLADEAAGRREERR